MKRENLMNAPTSEQIRAMREFLGRNQSQMATLVGTTQVTWSRWEDGTTPMPFFREKLWKLQDFVDKQKKSLKKED